MTRLERKDSEKLVPDSDVDDRTSEPTGDMEGPLEDDELDDADDFDKANEPSGDPAKNVPSA
jgi:hypothetical protein